MGFNKERERLQQLLDTVQRTVIFDESQIEVLHECHQEYAKIIAILYKKHPNIFGNCYNYDRVEIRGNKKFLKESFSDEARKANFIVYRDSLSGAAETAIAYITDFL